MRIVARLLVDRSLALLALAVAAMLWACVVASPPERLPRSLVPESAWTGPTAEQVEASFGVAETAIEEQ